MRTPVFHQRAKHSFASSVFAPPPFYLQVHVPVLELVETIRTKERGMMNNGLDREPPAKECIEMTLDFGVVRHLNKQGISSRHSTSTSPK